jgi:hypothetical protein
LGLQAFGDFYVERRDVGFEGRGWGRWGRWLAVCAGRGVAGHLGGETEASVLHLLYTVFGNR